MCQRWLLPGDHTCADWCRAVREYRLMSSQQTTGKGEDVKYLMTTTTVGLVRLAESKCVQAACINDNVDGITVMHGCIMVMCGLPASGKTTLVSQFQVSVSGELTCHLVDYDKLMPQEVERNLIQDKSNQVTEGEDLSSWKHYREEIVSCVDKLLHVMLSKQDSELCRNAERRTSVSEQHELANTDSSLKTGSGQLWDHFSDILGVNEIRTNSTDEMVVVVDDNMYYRSMRYDYYQLARKYSLGFCEVFVDCPPAAALDRNQQRMVGKVNDKVIVTMATKMEVPDSATYHWEKHSLLLSPDTEEKCSKMLSLVRSAMSDPVLVPVEDVEGQAESRRVCSANVIHQTDQIIRKLLAKHMKNAKEKGQSKEEMKRLSCKLSAVKAFILDEMRSGVITFDTDVQDAAKSEDSGLFRSVKELFEARTS